MFKSYLKTAWRSLLRHKGASLIKLAGLSIGIACCMLIVVYIDDELSYNTFNTHYAGIYRVNFIKQGDGETRIMATTPNPVGPAIAKDLSQVAAVARYYNRAGILEAGEGTSRKRFQEPNVFFADKPLFDVFTIPFVAGGVSDAPGTVVITRAMAKKYFGDDQTAVGRTMTFE